MNFMVMIVTVHIKTKIIDIGEETHVGRLIKCLLVIHRYIVRRNSNSVLIVLQITDF